MTTLYRVCVCVCVCGGGGGGGGGVSSVFELYCQRLHVMTPGSFSLRGSWLKLTAALEYLVYEFRESFDGIT